MLEPHALAGQGVHLRGVEGFPAIASDWPEPHAVRRDEQDAGLPSCKALNTQADGQPVTIKERKGFIIKFILVSRSCRGAKEGLFNGFWVIPALSDY